MQLKPVTFLEGKYSKYRNNTHMQTILLKALSEGITNIDDLKMISGARNAAEVYRTFDKLAIRKEYHAALARCGITMDSLISGIKQICETGDKDSTRLKAYQIILKSIGLDKYEKDEVEGQDWEEVLLKLNNKETAVPELSDGKNKKYSVDVPEIPESELDRINEERKLARELYG